MNAALAQFLDWSTLQFWWTLRLKSVRQWRLDSSKSRLEEAFRFLNGPDFIPIESLPAQVDFSDSLNFGFPTPRPCEFAENNIVDGRLYRCGGPDWRRNPVIILLHGGGDFLNHRFRFPWIVPGCNRAGFNAATVVAPYHFQRRSRQLGRWDYLRTAEAFAQGVAEIRALTGWFLGEGCPSVALWGISLGGWLAGLTVCRDTRLGAVVLTVPGVRMDYKFARAERVVWRRVREALQAQRPAREALNATPLNLTLAGPVISKENILLIEELHDLFVEPEGVEELWQKWGQPEIWRLPHGQLPHIRFELVGCEGVNENLAAVIGRFKQSLRALHSEGETGRADRDALGKQNQSQNRIRRKVTATAVRIDQKGVVCSYSGFTRLPDKD